jgi:hypothetical protein
MAAPESQPLTSSFRDPSGFVYYKNGTLYRQVYLSYKEDYELLISSGLYTALTRENLLISHTEVPSTGSVYKILQPELIPFISYPYEWCFSQLQDAALTTLRIQQTALTHGMSLKDASAFNIQFLAGKPIFIDTLSFEKYQENSPWIAYRQFCQHFLAPLALMSYRDLDLGRLSLLHLDGVPLPLASNLLPRKSILNLGLGTHLHLHAQSQVNHADDSSKSQRTYTLPKTQLNHLLTNLESTIRSLQPLKQATVWHDYYANTNYPDKARVTKEKQVKEWITQVAPTTVWDAGANDGTFANLATKQGILAIATDIDPRAVENGYQQAKSTHNPKLLPLILDLTNPSPAIGWGNQERQSFLERASFSLTLCLALVHHLAIANNLPLTTVASLFANHSSWLVIEFVPKNDSNTQRLLAARPDIFPEYTQEGFEQAFSKFFSIQEVARIPESSRILYLMKRKEVPSESC